MVLTGKHDYDLFPAFLDGMIEGADKGTKIIEGHGIRTYFLKTDEEFSSAMAVSREETAKLSRNPEKYMEKMTFATVLFPASPSSSPERQFTPEEFREAVESGMTYTDNYLWIWNEKESFWLREDVDPVPSDQPAVDSFDQLVTGRSFLRKGFGPIDIKKIDALVEGKEAGLKRVAEKNKQLL